MKLFKMTIVQSEEFEQNFIACQMAFGFVCTHKRKLVWIATFEEGDYEVVRETLEYCGSEYRGTWHM